MMCDKMATSHGVQADCCKKSGMMWLKLQRENVHITTRYFFDGRVNTDKEFTLGLHYFISRIFSTSTQYHSDYSTGIGIIMHYYINMY